MTAPITAARKRLLLQHLADKTMTVAQVAEEAGVTPRTVRSWRAKGGAEDEPDTTPPHSLSPGERQARAQRAMAAAGGSESEPPPPGAGDDGGAEGGGSPSPELAVAEAQDDDLADQLVTIGAVLIERVAAVALRLNQPSIPEETVRRVCTVRKADRDLLAALVPGALPAVRGVLGNMGSIGWQPLACVAGGLAVVMVVSGRREERARAIELGESEEAAVERVAHQLAAHGWHSPEQVQELRSLVTGARGDLDVMRAHQEDLEQRLAAAGTRERSLARDLEVAISTIRRLESPTEHDIPPREAGSESEIDPSVDPPLADDQADHPEPAE